MSTDILILGSNGQLGFDLVKILTQQNLSFVGLTVDDFDVLKDDVSKLDKYQAKYIVNCIATTDVDGMEDNSLLAFNINSNFVYLLAKYCNKNGIILFHLSTDYIFDGNKSTPYVEEDRPNPLNIYGISKYAGELLLQKYHDKYFLFRVSSLFGIAGASGKGGNFITTMQRLGKERDTLNVISDQITCPTATLDVARCITKFITDRIEEFGTYNCVSSNSCSWLEFSQKIFQLSNLDEEKIKPAAFASYKFKAKRPRFGVMSTKKLSKYYIMPTWQESLIEYFKLVI